MVETAERGAPPREKLIEFYRQMVLIRRFEEAAAVNYQRRKIGGFLHLYIGEEAVAVGVMDNLQPQDTIVAHYREHGHALARGSEPDGLMAELFGRSTGVSKGKGGSMHLYDAGRGFLGGYAIVGAHLPIAVGLAMAAKHKGENGISVCFFGDGAVNEGEFHEALNLASVWKTPVLFLCENNLYGMGTHLERSSAVPEVYKRAAAYAVKAERCNGMDIHEMWSAARSAIEYVRGEQKPFLLEAMCYRFRGHSMADPELYREKEEVAQWRLKDPIATLRAELVGSGQATEESLNAIDAEVEAEINEAVRFADESPEPAPEELWTDVYVGVKRESHHDD